MKKSFYYLQLEGAPLVSKVVILGKTITDNHAEAAVICFDECDNRVIVQDLGYNYIKLPSPDGGWFYQFVDHRTGGMALFFQTKAAMNAYKEQKKVRT